MALDEDLMATYKSRQHAAESARWKWSGRSLEPAAVTPGAGRHVGSTFVIVKEAAGLQPETILDGG